MPGRDSGSSQRWQIRCDVVTGSKVNKFGSTKGREREDGILHAGPIIRPLGDEKYEMVSVGPTTSMRMEKFEYEFVKETGVRVIVGKGKTLVQVCTGVFLFYKSHLFVYLRGRKNRTKGTLLVAKGTSLMARRVYDRDHRPAYSTTGYVYR